MKRRQLPRPWQYGLSVGLGAAALLLTAVLAAPLKGVFYMVPITVVVMTALYWGLGPSLAALAVTCLGYAYFFLEPRGALAIREAADITRLLGFGTTALVMSWLASRARAARSLERLSLERTESLARAERTTREFYERLQAVTASCSAASTVREVAEVLLRTGLSHLGVSAVNISTLADPEHLRISFSEGMSDDDLKAFPLLPISEQFPASECARTRAPVWVETREEIDARFPVLSELSARNGFASLGALPLTIGDELLGVLGFAFATPRVLAREERDYVLALANQAAEALARARSFEAERRAHDEAERTAALQERIMAVVGHDLRTPLGVILLGTASLGRRALAPEDLATVERIRRGADRMKAIIGDLLDLSRVRQGKGLSVNRRPLDVAEVIRGVVGELREGSGGQRVRLDVAGDTTISADGERLAQVMSNLVGNALQHGAGSPVDVQISGADGHVRVQIHNGGPAIPPAQLDRVFEPFKRGAGATPADGPTGSIGLGLFIAKELVVAHGGAITVSSDEACGTTFTVDLPRGRIATATAVAYQPAPQ